VRVPSFRLQHRFISLMAMSITLGFLALIGGLASAPPANAATSDFVFTGRGWGHGVGMSQWGAWQAAKEGVLFNDILAFYYPGTTLTTMSDPAAVLKVRLSADPPESAAVNFVQVDLKPSVTAATLVKKTGAGSESETLPAGTLINIFNRDGKIQVVTTAGPLGPFDYVDLVPTRAATDTSDGRVSLQMKTSSKTYESREYWGTIRVQPGDDPGELWVYNFVAVDKYVRDIGEVDLDWAMPSASGYAPEAVKAQAVAARTYALAKNGATLTDGWQDQYYAGYRLGARYPGLAQAAEETAGLILTYNGKPASTYFSAHSGGYTTNTAWGSTTPAYIVSQPDPWSLRAPPTSVSSAGPGWNWTYTISQTGFSEKVNDKLKDSSTGKTFDIGLVQRIEVITRDTSDSTSHARTLRLTGDNGTAQVSAMSLKSLLGLRSTLILTITGGEPLALGEFYDVSVNHLYHDQIARVVTTGLMGGYDNGLFKPDGSITRWQFAKISVNLYNVIHPSGQITLVDVTTPPFTDVPMKIGTLGDESDWVSAAEKAGLVEGVTSTSFQPYTILRRDEMAAMMCRALGWVDEAEALPKTTPGFADVPVTSEYWAAATYLKQQGILQGYPDPSGSGATVLKVDEAIKRQHVAVILCRVLDQAGH
jgi:SpoIID/LytB domain protein